MSANFQSWAFLDCCEVFVHTVATMGGARVGAWGFPAAAGDGGVDAAGPATHS